MDTIYYFGTPLHMAGHGFHICGNKQYLESASFSYSTFKHNFCPECIADDKKNKLLGDVFYFRVGKYTICYIEGGCYDKRLGTKSVFFTEEKLTFGELSIKIMSTPICRTIIKKMPFKVKWPLIKEVLDQMNIEE